MPSIEHLPTPWLTAIFIAASIATWVAGIELSNMTDVPAERIGLGQALGGGAILAAATALPEVSTGLASMKLKDYQLAVLIL